MKICVLVACLLTVFAGHSWATTATATAIATAAVGTPVDCSAKAAEKKLSGAAKNSFVKKCEKDAGGDVNALCMKSAADRKLAGAAKNSHIKKCTADGGPSKG